MAPRPNGPSSKREAPACRAAEPSGRLTAPGDFRARGHRAQASKEELSRAADKGTGPSSDISAATWVLGDSGTAPEGR